MAKNPRQKQTFVTKKHLARQQREQRSIRMITISAIVVIVAVIGLIGFGVLNERVLKGLQSVAIVNGEKITTNEFQAQARLARQNLVDNALSTYQFAQQFGNNPQFLSSLSSQLSQIQSQLEPVILGNQVLEQMIQDRLIRQEASRRGITVSQEEIEQSVQEACGYYQNGTPTPEPTLAEKPTSTLSSLQMTLTAPTATLAFSPTLAATQAFTPTATLEPTVTPTATATITPIPSPTPTQAPTATPTEYTLEGYQQLYKDQLERLKSIDFDEDDLRYIIESQLYREKVLDAVLAESDLTAEEDQVWARHILVPDEATANIVLGRLADGEDWSELAALFSTDTSNKDFGGDLGWFGKGRMVAEFENAAFALDVGETSQPVQTSFGWHIIQVLGHEARPLSQDEYEQLRQTRFDEWIKEQRDATEVETLEIWQERVPTEPAFPAEVEGFIQAVQQQLLQQSQPTVPAPSVTEEAPTQ